jgi:N-terminal domain of toast_rack, DUF2154
MDLRKEIRMIARMALLVAGALLMCGCVAEMRGPTQHDFRSIDLDKAERVHVNLRMGAGNLRVGAGTQKLMRADFSYNVPSWKPYVHYSSTGGEGNLTIEQPGTHHGHFGHTTYEWDVRLSRDVPVDLRVNFGAGEAQMDVGSLMLRGIDVEMGVGKLDLDLRGNPKQNYEVRIRGGVGEATVRLPRDVGVAAHAEGGIGEIKASGLRQEGRDYYNEAYGQSKVTVRVDVHGGIGSIRLISD